MAAKHFLSDALSLSGVFYRHWRSYGYGRARSFWEGVKAGVLTASASGK